MYAIVGYSTVALVVLYLVSNTFLFGARRQLPPGPNTHWLKGGRLPEKFPWLVYQEWRKTYGDVVYIRVFGNPILILNSAEAAHELLGKRSKIYSSRPIKTMMVELMGFGWSFSMMPYGDTWRRHRALFNQHIHPGTKGFRPIQQKETSVMLRDLLQAPKRFDDHIRKSQSSILLGISYGRKMSGNWDEVASLNDKMIRGIYPASVYGNFLVDYLPILQYVPSWMPGASFKQTAKTVQHLTQEMLNRPYEEVKQKIAEGTATPCIVTAAYEKYAKPNLSKEDETMIKGVAAIAYTAGTETTIITIRNLILAMLTYPEVQKKAQAQLDSVVGRDRIPSFDDKAELPYISWIVWECLRWRPPSPTGVTHYTTADDEYLGYHIPKGTTVLANIWAMFHNEEAYPNPSEFVPERFEGKTEEITGLNDIPNPAFGFGRRICPGQAFAFESVWMAAASILFAFNITKALDSEGHPIEPKIQYTSGTVSFPLPFECDISPRFEGVGQLIEQAQD